MESSSARVRSRSGTWSNEARSESSPKPSPTRTRFYVDERAAEQSRYGRLLAPPTFPRTFDYGEIEGLRLPVAGMIHGEFDIAYERPIFVGEDLLCRMELKDSYDKQSRRGLLGFLLFERTGESFEGERIFTMNDVVVVTGAVRKVIEA